MDTSKFLVPHNKPIKLSDYDPAYAVDEDDDKCEKKLDKDIKKMAKLQDKFYAFDKHAILIVFQAMDAAGKDSTIEHVMSGLNPQGCEVTSFKQPTDEELDHDYLWRCYKALPRRGYIGIFNRSHYEEVLVVRVHPEYIVGQNIPGIKSVEDVTPDFWQQRYESINAFEKHVAANGTHVIKFFLHVSKEEQKNRFMRRIERDDKHWKFSISDVKERQHWQAYQQAFEDAINATSTEWAPWYIIPADHKWYMRRVVGEIILDKLQSLSMEYPTLNGKEKEELEKGRQMLEAED